MYNSLALFSRNLKESRNLDGIYEFLSGHVIAPVSLDDLLRSQIVYAVSAFDKLIHDLVRVGMVQTFSGIRHPTAKYLSETISIALYNSFESATVPPKEILFEQAIVRKLKTLSFQEPIKVADGLSYIWEEQQKWQKITLSMGMDEKRARTMLKLIADRRNQIVHEADMDPISNTKFSVFRSECKEITDFLELCGNTIYRLVQ